MMLMTLRFRTPTCLYAGRTVGGDRHHRHVDCHPVAGGASCPRSRAALAMREQSEAMGPGDAQLSKLDRLFPAELDVGHQSNTSGRAVVGVRATAAVHRRRNAVQKHRFHRFLQAQTTDAGKNVKSTRIPLLFCPSEANDKPKLNSTPACRITSTSTTPRMWACGWSGTRSSKPARRVLSQQPVEAFKLHATA